MSNATAAHSTAGSHVVIAELVVKPERLGAFTELAQAFAAECLALEPGCRQFQVVELGTSPGHVLFFETYDDIAAFDAHRTSQHLERFQAAFGPMVSAEQPLRQGRRRPAWP